ncbi:hypothetical protein OK910_05650 [Streptococcus pneumoniae]|nr:hypothetical protein [Streptococcus pneumoniae]MDG9489820.1 hypothetical protein [Streptococcus pneumoniae]
MIYAEKSFFDKSQSGELTSAIVNDTSVIREFLITTFPNPKFQVEVSHPKEIHLATCSPSIF